MLLYKSVQDIRNHLVDIHLQDGRIAKEMAAVETEQLTISATHVINFNKTINSVPEIKDVDQIATKIVESQIIQNKDVLNAIRAVENEKLLYQDVASFREGYDFSDEKKRKCKWYSDGMVILNGSLDLMNVLKQRIIQTVIGDEFVKAYQEKDLKKCAKMIFSAFCESAFVSYVMKSKEATRIIETLTLILTIIADKIGFIGVDGLSYIVGGAITVLVCCFDSGLNDSFQTSTIIFNAVVSMCFSWTISIPLIIMRCKANEVWSNLKNDPKHISFYDKSKIIANAVFIELPMNTVVRPIYFGISSVFGLFFNNSIKNDTSKEIVVFKGNNCSKKKDQTYIPDIFKCSLNNKKLEDPVSLHGFIFERRNIMIFINKKREHPFTRKHATIHQIVTPPTEYMEAFNNFFKKVKND